MASTDSREAVMPNHSIEEMSWVFHLLGLRQRCPVAGLLLGYLGAARAHSALAFLQGHGHNLRRSKAPAPFSTAPNLRFNSDAPSARRLTSTLGLALASAVPPPRAPAALPGCWPTAWPSGRCSGTPSLLSCKASAIISGKAAAFQGPVTLLTSA